MAETGAGSAQLPRQLPPHVWAENRYPVPHTLRHRPGPLLPHDPVHTVGILLGCCPTSILCNSVSPSLVQCNKISCHAEHRDVAPRIGFLKPALIESRFFPALQARSHTLHRSAAYCMPILQSTLTAGISLNACARP